MALTVGESIFVNSLYKEVPRQTSAIPAQRVIDVGASGLHLLTKSPAVLAALRKAYSASVSKTMYFSLAVAGVALMVAFGMEWLNVKKVAAKRKLDEIDNTNQDCKEI